MPLPDSLTLAELKRRIDKTLTADDDLLEQYLEAAFEQAQAPPPYGCGRLLTPLPALVGDPSADTAPAVEKTFNVSGRRVLVPDAREITQVLVDDVAVTDYKTLERDGHVVRITLARTLPYGYPAYTTCDALPTPDEREVKVTGRFGFTVLPESLKDAIYTLAARSWYERAANYADQVALPEGGGVEAYYRQLPPRTKLVFGTFAVPAGLGGLK